MEKDGDAGDAVCANFFQLWKYMLQIERTNSLVRVPTLSLRNSLLSPLNPNKLTN